MTVTDLRNDPEALAAFQRSWDWNPIEHGKFFGLRFTLRSGQVRCSRVFTTEQSAKRALFAGNPR